MKQDNIIEFLKNIKGEFIMIDGTFRTFTKIKGVTKKNEDGEDIQEILSTIDPECDFIYFLHDSFGQYGPEVSVYCKDSHIGYLSKELAEQICDFLDTHIEYELDGELSEITGGDDLSYGCNIEIYFKRKTDDEIRRALQRQYIEQQIVKNRSAKHTSPQKRNTKGQKAFMIIMAIFFFILAFFTGVMSIALFATDSRGVGIAFLIIFAFTLFFGIVSTLKSKQ